MPLYYFEKFSKKDSHSVQSPPFSGHYGNSPAKFSLTAVLAEWGRACNWIALSNALLKIQVCANHYQAKFCFE